MSHIHDIYTGDVRPKPNVHHVLLL